MSKPSRNTDRPPYPVPKSVFYKGKRPGKCNSFRPATETQALIERAQQRKQRSKDR